MATIAPWTSVIPSRTIASLVHPHIIRVLEFGIEDTTPYLVLDYAPHGSLRARLPKGARLPVAAILPYVQQAAQALQFAHDARLIHRDVKPENLLLGRSQELLLRYEIALDRQISRALLRLRKKAA